MEVKKLIIRKKQILNDKKPLVYISHPYAGKKDNFDKVTLLMQDLMAYSSMYTFISPLHALSFEGYHETDYDVGLEHCIDLLRHCDEMWVFGDWKTSKGCTAEINYCNNKIVPVRYFSDYQVDLNKYSKIEF